MFFKIGKVKKSIGWAKYVYVCEWDMYWRNFCNFSLVTKKCEKFVKYSPCFKWAPFWYLISKKENNYVFLKINYQNSTKKIQFCNFFFPKQGETRTNHGPIPHPSKWLFSRILPEHGKPNLIVISVEKSLYPTGLMLLSKIQSKMICAIVYWEPH